ncbi:MAG: putative hydrolase YutF [Promethearchaeota archaeon]|nr:MAG: putative hydrolase YutF [Candidatus Lokiarchaeota archaeon]
MIELIPELAELELAIFDLDGVVYRGSQLIPNVDSIIQTLKDNSIDVVFNSNNSTATRKAYVKRLTNMNIQCKREDFYTSASITASEITKLNQNAKIFVIGEIGLKEELKAKGHYIIKHKKEFKLVDYVIVGLDRDFHYKNLAIAQKCILEGNAIFYATNADSTLPSEDGLMPGAGVMVNAVQVCTGHPPKKIFGKPNPFGILSILEDRQLSAEKTCIFGDRLNTDIMAGNRAGIKTIAVMTGVTNKKEINELRKKSQNSDKIDKDLLPDLVLENLNDLFVR